ncbi:MAG: tol-pal system-associated acyl-CoA thioesterase [Caldimonas sp.]
MTQAERGGFKIAMRIYWEDTDASGVVFYANYLKFFERARTEWLRALGFGQEALRRDAGVAFVVSETALRYLRPARLDDSIEVSVDVAHLRLASLEISQQARRGNELLADATIRIGCVELGTFRPCRIPNNIRMSIGPANAMGRP